MDRQDQHSHETRDFASAIAPDWLERLVAVLDDIQEAVEKNAEATKALPDAPEGTEAPQQATEAPQRAPEGTESKVGTEAQQQATEATQRATEGTESKVGTEAQQQATEAPQQALEGTESKVGTEAQQQATEGTQRATEAGTSPTSPTSSKEAKGAGQSQAPASPTLPPDLLDDLQGFHPGEAAYVYQSLNGDERKLLLQLAGAKFPATALAWLDDSLVAQAASALGESAVITALAELDSDDALAVFENLDEETRDGLLTRLPPRTRKHIQQAMVFPEDSAGRLMQTEVPVVPESWTVGQTIDWMRAFRKELTDDFYELIVVDEHYKPIGRTPLSRILQAPRPTALTELFTARIHSVSATTHQEDVARTFKQYALVTAPVIDGNGRLLGVITADDIVDVIEEELSKDMMRLGGVQDGGLFGDLLVTMRARVPWLILNFGTILIAASVIDAFSETIEGYIALAVLLPIVASIGGNAGTQSLTVAVRGLAQRLLERPQRWRFLRRELLINLLNGVVMAALVGGLSAVWFHAPLLGLVVALALLVNIVTAGFAGALIPIVLQRIGVDPAVASGVFVTTITDTVGFFSLLALATLIFL